MSAGGPVLQARALQIGYPGKTVGRGIDLALGRGEILCLLGPNGSGKTTLFKTLLGLLTPQDGEVLVGGRALGQLTRRQIAQVTAYVPQAHTAHFPFKVFDMVLMGRTAHLGLFAAPSGEDRRRAADALDLLGIGELAGIEYTRLSGGQRQLVLIARAIAQDARVIVMDEPTASLDFGNQVIVLAEVKRLASQNTAIILSTHDPDHALSIADSVALLHDGLFVAQGEPEATLLPDRLRQVYGVDVTIERLSGGQIVCAPDYRRLSAP